MPTIYAGSEKALHFYLRVIPYTETAQTLGKGENLIFSCHVKRFKCPVFNKKIAKYTKKKKNDPFKEK